MNRSITILISLLLFAFLCYYCVRHHAPMIQQDVLMRTERTLSDNGITVPIGALSVNGRDVLLSGVEGSPVLSEKTQAMAAAVKGVRVVNVAIQTPAADASTHIGKAQAQQKVDEVLESKIVEFNTGSAELTVAGRNTLDQIVPLLAASPALLCDINGYTDTLGDKQENMQLSDRRAAATKNYLVNQGIAADRLTANGCGDARPIASNDTPDGRRKNRRIEFLLKEK